MSVSAATEPPAAAARPWFSSYPEGVPQEIDVAAVGGLIDRINRSIVTYADRDAFESFGVNFTYGAVAAQAKAFAGWLQKQGLDRGDRVALMMPNVMAYPIALIGTLMAGCVVVNVNPLYTPRELEHQLKDSGARAIVVLENFAHTVEATLPHAPVERVVVASAGDALGFKGAIISFVARHIKKLVPRYEIPGAVSFKAALASKAPFKPATIAPEDIAFLQYTGGTTGVSKGATLTHRNVAANIAQVEAWFASSMAKTDGQPVMVTALPLYHIYALTCCCFYLFALGGKNLLIANPRDIPGFIKTLRHSRFTCFSGVNTLYNALVHHPDIGKVDFSKLTMASAGGMAMQSAVAKQWKARTGVPVTEGYGLSETSPVLTTNRPDIVDFTGTIGFPLPSTDIAIRDPATGAEVSQGEPGELCAKGPQVMAGYWNRPDETARATTNDGYFRTGDIAVMNADGSFRIVDRLKDMIIVSGFNVYPNEVEEVLSQHPGVLEVAVVGQPDEHSGEAVAAYVVKRDPALTEQALRDYARENLAGYKRPKTIVFRDSLPKTNVGKVLRRALREEAAG
ncbi:MAG: long-chain fatty acid--CoA ligase [Rhizobiales bacterium 65-9]|nr:AMP-binding protein [Hyphomicrobiales bacterium]OJY35825.1 MAG: long-chain fatty acid--CoA ligase [Rhizobiales bacterium 65-9]